MNDPTETLCEVCGVKEVIHTSICSKCAAEERGHDNDRETELP